MKDMKYNIIKAAGSDKMNKNIYKSLLITFLVIFLSIPIFATTLSVSPQRITVNVREGQSAPNQTITIQNTGDERINYAISSRQNWISVQPVRGTLQRRQSTRHQVRLNTSRLRTGQHRGTIEVRSQALSRSIEIDVVVTVEEQIELRVSPGAINITLHPGERPSDTTLSVSSTSRQGVRYQVRSDSGWIRVTPSYGTAYSSRQQRHRVSLSTQQIRGGTYNGRITITSPDALNSPLHVPVRITIHDEPALEVSPHYIRHRLRRDERLRDETLSIRNTSDRTISYNVRTDAHWVQVRPNRGRIHARRTHNLTIEYDIGRLFPGTHRARIRIDSRDLPNQTKEIPIEIIVSRQDLVRINPSTLNLSARGDMDRGRFTMSIQNLSHEHLDFRIRAFNPWMSVTPQRGWLLPNRSQDLEITFYLNSMHYGTNRGFIEIDIPSHYEDPIEVPVYVNRRRQ